MSRIQPPVYNDDVATLYEIKTTDDDQATEYITATGVSIPCQFISVSDRLRAELEASNVAVERKVRVPYYEDLGSASVMMIGSHQYKIYNVYSFVNNLGFRQMDVTLIKPGTTYAVK